jgi:hypothetical protein
MGEVQVQVEIPSKDERLACMVRGLAYYYGSQRAVTGATLDVDGFLLLKIPSEPRANEFRKDVERYFGPHGVMVAP